MTFRVTWRLCVLGALAMAGAMPPAAAQASTTSTAPTSLVPDDAVVEPFRRWRYELGPTPTPEEGAALRQALANAERRDPEAAYLAAIAAMESALGGYTKSEALELITYAAEAGHLPARTFVATVQITGQFPEAIPPDRAVGMKAVHAAYEAGDAEAALWLGLMFGSGESGFEVNPSLAERYLEEALVRGQRKALYPLGGLRVHVGRVDEGYALMQQAADAGDVRARLVLADSIMKGSYRRADPERAVRMLEEWRSRGDRPDGDLSRLLARAYLDGYGQPESGYAIMVVAHEAATLGDAEGALMLADIFFYGLRELAPDPEKGVQTLRILSDRGNREAKFRLAEVYLEGVFVERDLAKARELLEAAAERGHEKSQRYRRVMDRETGDPKAAEK